MRIAITSNGPGEVAGWFRPLARHLYARDPHCDICLFLVPDDYATGYEADLARRLFPQAKVFDPKTYVKFALGALVEGAPESADVVLYLGGDLMHAMRLRSRLRAKGASYKFYKPGYRTSIARLYAVDEANVEQLLASRAPRDKIEIVGNLAVDGALIEAQAALEATAPADGIVIMPGSRGYEVEHMIPFFFTMAQRIVRERANVPIAFGVSPYTPLEDIRSAIEAGGDARVYAQKGRLIEEGGVAFLATADRAVRFPILRNALAAATKARLVVTIPGTKTIELAALGVPTIAITPLNAAELITFNGPLTYLDRLPVIGRALKREVAVRISERFTYHTQPNMDADDMVICELHGTLTPGRVARVALERFDDAAWLRVARERLAALYAPHVGAADRMAASLLAFAGSQA